MTIRLATRGSTLALWQAGHVRDALVAADPATDVELVVVETTGDRVTDVPLASIGDRGLFTREIDSAVLDGRADAAVHSLKDLPTRLEDGLALVAVLERADSRDAFVPGPGVAASIDDLPAGARVGTSALRRRAQLLARRPDLEVVDLRGNLDTRIAKVRRGDCDGALLAVAGLVRLGLDAAIGQVLEPPEWLPAVGQGAVAVVGGPDAAAPLRALDHAPTRAAAEAERAFLRGLEGGCQVPIGAWTRIHGDDLELHGMVASLDGSRVLRDSRRGPVDHARDVGATLAGALLDRGAADILKGIRAGSPPVTPP